MSNFNSNGSSNCRCVSANDIGHAFLFIVFALAVGAFFYHKMTGSHHSSDDGCLTCPSSN